MVFKSICYIFKGVNELTFAFGLISISIKDILQDILLISLNVSHQVDIPKTHPYILLQFYNFVFFLGSPQL